MADFPEDSIQRQVGGTWWIEDKKPSLVPGRLLWAYVPYLTQTPRTLVPIARTDDKNHGEAKFRLDELRIHQKARDQTPLPVAGMPLNPGEVYLVRKAKRRPVLVLGGGEGTMPPKPAGAAPANYVPTVLVAPYYGVDQNEKRGGWRPELVSAVRRLKWPQYFWDRLPNSSTSESILRLDNVQALGRHHDSYDPMKWRLSEEAVSVVLDYFRWLLTNKMAEESFLHIIKTEFDEVYGDTTT